jgi:hypothetical protein
MSDPHPKVKVPNTVTCQTDTSGCRIENIDVLIQRRAYELYEGRGRKPGHEQEDWLQAEREVRNHLGLTNPKE